MSRQPRHPGFEAWLAESRRNHSRAQRTACRARTNRPLRRCSCVQLAVPGLGRSRSLEAGLGELVGSGSSELGSECKHRSHHRRTCDRAAVQSMHPSHHRRLHTSRIQEHPSSGCSRDPRCATSSNRSPSVEMRIHIQEARLEPHRRSPLGLHQTSQGW